MSPLEFQHVNVKLLVKHPEKVDLEALLAVFHGWIQDQAGDELLLDVADYRHVHSGPGIVLIGHDGNYSLDNTGGRLGVRYNRKTAWEGTNQERLVQAAQAALLACKRLEVEPLLGGIIRFDGRNIEVTINDRLLAPNSEEAQAASRSEFETFFSTLFAGGEFHLSFPSDPRSLLGVRVTSSQTFDVSTLLENIGFPVPVPGSSS